MEKKDTEIPISENNENNIKTKIIIFKGKEKEIPEHNPDKSKCEFYLISKFRYCHFDKYKGGEFCVHHIQNNLDDFQICPYDPKHRVKKSKYKQHLKTCNTLAKQKEIQNNPWYKKNINHAKDLNNLLPNEQTLSTLYEAKWDDLSTEEFESILNTIINSYSTIREMYKTYSSSNKLEETLKHMNVNYTLSGMVIDEDKNINSTDQVVHSIKHNIQNEEISSVSFKSGLIDTKENYLVIEFGAGKGGLSKAVNSLVTSEHCCVNILLERQGLRHKKEANTENMLRYRTDIIDFDLNYLDKINLINVDDKIKDKLKTSHKIVGVAKHICGCAFDLSLTCLFNHEKFNSLVKGLCMATCCHHLNRVELLNHLDFYVNKLKMSVKEIIYLFKATSWVFGSIRNHNKDTNVKKDKDDIFRKKNLTRKQIGQMSKYIIDLARCMLLIEKGFKVFYLKYCDKGITTENNLILAIK